MSSTNRGRDRQKDDLYETPAWCVKALLDSVVLPSGRWLEPAFGNGAIVEAVNDRILRGAVQWTAMDINPNWKQMDRHAQVAYGGDFLAINPSDWGHYNVAITNPPFSLASGFITRALEMTQGGFVVMLLRLAFLAGQKRSQFMSTHCPDVYVLSRRPSFVNGKTDSADYAWFVWGPDRNRREGKIQVIG